MPAEIIDRPNPGPLPSSIPDAVLDLTVKLQNADISSKELSSLVEFRKAACYIAACEKIENTERFYHANPRN